MATKVLWAQSILTACVTKLMQRDVALVNPATLTTAVRLIFTSICVVFGCDITIVFAASLDAKCAAVLTTTCSTSFGEGTTVVAACSDGGTAANPKHKCLQCCSCL